jgi:hypothetical protein
MRIVTARRISQIFFFLLFLWFCIVSTLGEQWWQLRGWPVNWLIQLDPWWAWAPCWPPAPFTPACCGAWRP